jgi:uncharacterized protein YjeT (DUF2065 family)
MHILSHLNFFNVTLSILTLIHFGEAILNISFPDICRKKTRERMNNTNEQLIFSGLIHLIIVVSLFYILTNYN